MTFVKQHFRGQILWCAAKRVCARLAILGETEVCQFQITLFIDQNVLRFQISVDDVEGVEIFKHETDLSSVKPRYKLAKSRTVAMSLCM